MVLGQAKNVAGFLCAQRPNWCHPERGSVLFRDIFLAQVDLEIGLFAFLLGLSEFPKNPIPTRTAPRAPGSTKSTSNNMGPSDLASLIDYLTVF